MRYAGYGSAERRQGPCPALPCMAHDGAEPPFITEPGTDLKKHEIVDGDATNRNSLAKQNEPASASEAVRRAASRATRLTEEG